jgi:hypothetical protein
MNNIETNREKEIEVRESVTEPKDRLRELYGFYSQGGILGLIESLEAENTTEIELRADLMTILDTYGFWGRVQLDRHELSHGQGLPHLGLIHLDHTEPSTHNSTVRFYRREQDDSEEQVDEIVIYGVTASDFGMGMDTMWFVGEYLSIDGHGNVEQKLEYHPYEGSTSITFGSKKREYDNLDTLRRLIVIGVNGMYLQEQGKVYKYDRDSERMIVKPAILTEQGD